MDFTQSNQATLLASMETNYSKRELDHFFSDMRARLDKQDGMLEKILAQATKTNGRVNGLEYWRNAIAWASGVLITFSVIVINKLWR